MYSRPVTILNILRLFIVEDAPRELRGMKCNLPSAKRAARRVREAWGEALMFIWEEVEAWLYQTYGIDLSPNLEPDSEEDEWLEERLENLKAQEPLD